MKCNSWQLIVRIAIGTYPYSANRIGVVLKKCMSMRNADKLLQLLTVIKLTENILNMPNIIDYIVLNFDCFLSMFLFLG